MPPGFHRYQKKTKRLQLSQALAVVEILAFSGVPENTNRRDSLSRKRETTHPTSPCSQAGVASPVHDRVSG